MTQNSSQELETRVQPIFSHHPRGSDSWWPLDSAAKILGEFHIGTTPPKVEGKCVKCDKYNTSCVFMFICNKGTI